MLHAKVIFTTSLAAAVLLVAPLANADTADAFCEVHVKGKKNERATGPCSFSQRQGYVDIELRNGERHSLSPGGKANTFKDEKGTPVERRIPDDNSHQYVWRNWNVIVRFDGYGDDGQGAMAGSDSGGEDGGFTATQQVRIDGSSGGAEYSDGLTPGSSTRWELNARDMQNLYVRVAAQGPDIYYQIFNPDGTFLLEQMSSSTEYRGQLWQSGKHVIEVINRGSRNVSYNIIIGLD